MADKKFEWLTEEICLEAYNILRGINIKDYSQTYGIKSGTILLPEKARKRRGKGWKKAGKKLEKSERQKTSLKNMKKELRF